MQEVNQRASKSECKMQKRDDVARGFGRQHLKTIAGYGRQCDQPERCHSRGSSTILAISKLDDGVATVYPSEKEQESGSAECDPDSAEFLPRSIRGALAGGVMGRECRVRGTL